jgi:hypothetical protein
MPKNTTSLFVTALAVTALSAAAFGRNMPPPAVHVSPAPGGASIDGEPGNGPITGSDHVGRGDLVQREKPEGTVKKVCPKCDGRRWLPFRGIWLGIQRPPVAVACEECHGDGYVTYELIRRRR